jgi:hypothetical protein
MQNQTIIDFSLPSTGNTTFQLASAKGRHLVIYFYPKDNTPGCTTEGQAFCDQFPAFQADQAVRARHQRADARSDEPVPLRGARHLRADDDARGTRQQQEGHVGSGPQRAPGQPLPRRDRALPRTTSPRGHPLGGTAPRPGQRPPVPADRGDQRRPAAACRPARPTTRSSAW